MTEVKVVITGPVGAGKTAAIATLSDIEVITTDVNATDEVRQQKATTTVAMDYGEVNLDDGTTICLYGTPGQERFNYMWEILCEGALGLIVLVNDQAESPLDDLAFYLKAFERFARYQPVVIGVTHIDGQQEHMAKYHQFMAEQSLLHPVFQLDAREPSEVRVLVEAMSMVARVA